jgi:5-methylcytosine-specific restriction endonuclease McrA
MNKQADPSECELCQRNTQLTFHHLIPRKLHRRPRFKKHFSSDELNSGVMLCYDCHRAIHRFYDEMTLAKDYSTLAALKEDPAVQKHIRWIQKLAVSQ